MCLTRGNEPKPKINHCVGSVTFRSKKITAKKKKIQLRHALHSVKKTISYLLGNFGGALRTKTK